MAGIDSERTLGSRDAGAGSRPPGREVVEAALNEGRRALREREAKDLLAAYGLPVVDGREVHSPGGAVEAARRLGYPVVLKGASSEILHKSEAGLVLVGLSSDEQVREGYESLRRRGDGRLEAVLVERMAEGRRELVAGLTTDPQFGPVVMVGLGGVLTEALDDVAFAVAPLTLRDGLDMLDALRSRRLLGPFRGEPPVDRPALARLLVTLGRLALDHPEVREVDCNPVMLEGGAPLVVDALVALGPPPPPATSRGVDLDRLEAVFSPGSVAVVGASNTVTKWGGTIMTNLLAGGYGGQVFPVNPTAEEVFGLPAYPSVTDIPAVPELALVAVPAGAVRGVVEECGRKGVRAVVVITSGFSEVSREGAQEEEAVAETARSYGMALIGPNCMGIVSSWSRLYATGAAILRPQVGPVSFISQSGNMGIQLMSSAEERRGGIGKFVGVGNEAQTTTTDFLEFFRRDPETGVILAYLEGVEDGRRFLDQARATTPDKPVVVLRGGTSAYGSRAAASHTGALAGSARVFQGAARQAGIMVTYDPDEFLDLAFALSYLPPPPGRRAAVVTMGGGWGVLSADEAARNDLELAELPEEIIEELDGVLPPFWNRANPVDLVGTTAPGVAERALEVITRSSAVDLVVILGVVGMMTTPIRIFAETDALKEERDFDLGYPERPDTDQYCLREGAFMRRVSELMEECEKPIINVSFTPIEQAVFTYGGRYATVVLPSPLRGVRVAAQMARYGSYLRRGEESP